MKNSKFSVLTALLLLMAATVVSAQSRNQVIIIEEYTDENGEKQTKKTIKEWDGDMNDLLQDQMPDNLDFDSFFGQNGISFFDSNGFRGGFPGEASSPWLGISMEATEAGVKVVDVNAESPAKRAGLLAGDMIVSIDDQPVSTPEDVVDYISSQDVNDIISIEYKRDGETKHTEAALSSRGSGNWFSQMFPQWDGLESMPQIQFGDVDMGNPLMWRSDESPRLGATVQNHPEQGVEIVTVSPGSIAESAGLRQGDVIVRYGDKDISEVDELVDELSRQQWNETQRFEFLREGQLLVTEAEFIKEEAPRPKNLRKL